jgi:hypothetical protein
LMTPIQPHLPEPLQKNMIYPLLFPKVTQQS